MAVHWGGRGIGHAGRRSKASRIVPSLPSPLTATEEALTEPGAWNTVKWQGGSTKGEGLAALLGDATWNPALGQLGTDFGNTTAEGSLAAGSTHPTWTGTYLNVSLYTTAGNVTVEGYDIDGWIEVGAMDAELLVKNCVIRGVPGSLPIRNVMQNDSTQPVYIENCVLQGATAQNVALGNGHIKRSYFYESDQFGLSFLGANLLVDECFVRKMATVADAHGEALFIYGADDLVVTRNTFYLPDGSLPYGEGDTGLNTGITACIFIAPGSAGATSDVNSGFIAGNLMAGGAHALYCGGGSGRTIQNICTVNNVVASGADYTSLEPISITGNVGSIHRNLLFYGNVDENGAPLTIGGVDANGIWNFDKPTMDDRTRYIGEKVGYLDSNGDPLPGWSRT